MNGRTYWQREPDRERRAAERESGARLAAERRRQAQREADGQMMTAAMRSQLAPRRRTILPPDPTNKPMNDMLHGMWRENQARSMGLPYDQDEDDRG